MKSKKHEISSMEHMSFSSKKVLASVVAGLLFAAPVFATVETVAPSLGLADQAAYAAVASKPQVNTIHDSIVQFKDPVLKKRILSQMKKQNLISQSAQDITEEDALKVKELIMSSDPGDDKIQSIEGIENFKNLTWLSLSDNQITDITPLKGLTNLTYLALSGCHITDITPLKGLTKLESCLDLNYNQITDITPLAGMTNLSSLDLRQNKITDVTPLAGMTNLTNLLLSDNQITDITPLAGLTKLEYGLDLNQNKITDVTPLKGLTKLSSLDLSQNKITDVTPLAGLKKLYSLNLQSNQIKNLECLSMSHGFFAVTEASLQTINLQPTTLTVDLKKEIKGFGNVTFYLDENVSNGVLTYKEGMKNPYQVKAYERDSVGVELVYTADINIDFSKAKNPIIIQFKDAVLKKRILSEMKKQNLINQSAQDITEEDALKVKELDLSGFSSVDKFQSIEGIENFKNLTKLYLSDNHITDLTPLAGMTKLETLDATAQTINLQPTTATVDLKKEIKAFGNPSVALDENVSNGVLTYKEGMKNPYQVKVHEENGEHKYSATINVDFPKAKINSEIQTEDTSEELQKLLDGDSTVKATDNYKNADDNLKQAYDKAITDGKTIYDKLSSTPEQVQQAAEKIKAALGKLNGDAKSSTATSQLQGQLDAANGKIQTLSGELEKAKQQGTADASTIQSLTEQLQQTKNALEKLKSDKTLSDQQKQAEIDRLNGQITELGKQIEKLTQENTSLKSQIATLQATVARLTEEANQCHVSDGAKAQELEKVKQQLTQAQGDLEKLKQDKTQSDQEKQKEIDRLNGQVTQLNQEIDKLKQEKSTLTQQLQDATSQVNTLNSQLEQLKNDKKQADEKNKQTISGLNTQVQQLTHDKQGLQEQITTKQKEIEKLNTQIQTLKDDHSKSDQEKQKEIERLSGQVNTLTQEKKDLQGKLDAANEKVRSLTEQIDKLKQQHTADASTIQSLTQQLQQTKQQLEDLKHNKTLSDTQKQVEIDKLNAQITNLGKQIAKLTQENTSLKSQIATLQATVARLTEEANQCHVSDGAKAQELEKVKQQLTQAQADLEKLKTDKTQSDQEKQKEIDRLNGQVTQLNQEIVKLKQENPTGGSSEGSGTSTGSSVSIGGFGAFGEDNDSDANAPASMSAMYRLYNPWTGEHLFTTDAHEVQTLVALGWQDEGIIGQVSMKEGKAVYRLYNPNTGEHHFTTDLAEVERCVANGWVKEGIAFYSQGDQAVFSMYNPYAKSFYHHYTSDENEIAQMVKDGWKKEGVKWYCAPVQPHNLVK